VIGPIILPVQRAIEQVDDGTVRCGSTTDGMRCVDRRTHHGFLVSREAARLL